MAILIGARGERGTRLAEKDHRTRSPTDEHLRRQAGIGKRVGQKGADRFSWAGGLAVPVYFSAGYSVNSSTQTRRPNWGDNKIQNQKGGWQVDMRLHGSLTLGRKTRGNSLKEAWQ
ncbi:MAG: hypothetical protein CVU57_14225 [Deltaproteobacteria bacterium HGW-Deltaproteobacteria-15]|jgi:hypothetical protein|nr:MAG: hypothetical protein CVU57_14225 [Deltaproteobacteria bacterium HGW-Deltaproteobacteria-15]